MARVKNGVRKDAQEMYSMMELYGESGLSRIEFCEEMNLAPHTFQYWLKKYNSQKSKRSQQAKDKFVKLDIKSTPLSTDIDHVMRIKYPSGVIVELPLL